MLTDFSISTAGGITVKKFYTFMLVIALLSMQIGLTIFIAQPPKNTEEVLAQRNEYVKQFTPRAWELIGRDQSQIGRGMEVFFLNFLFGLIPAVIAKRKGLCSNNKGRCTFMVWWVYGTLLFLVALPHSLISKADVQAIEKNKQERERKQQLFIQERERKQQRNKQNVDRVLQGIKKFGERKDQREKLLQIINTKTGGKSVSVVAIGGNGWEFLTNKKLIAGLGADGLYLWDMETLKDYKVPSQTITDVAVSGPGTVHSGGGVMGGGFGLDGFLVGAAAATVLNILTSHKKTKTLVHLKCDDSEIFLLISTMEPDETRIFLSPLFVSLTAKSNASKSASGVSGIAEEIAKLAKLLAEGHITSEEFANLKSSLF